MTTGSTQRPERLARNNAVLLLVDHQIGLYTGIRDIDVLQLKHNIVGLTRAMLALKVPVIVTTTTEKMWGPIIPELAEVLPGLQGIERTSVNAWDEKRFVDAVKATGRKNLIVTGISTDVCLTFPAIAALADGFQSYAVIDASGGFSQTQVDMGVLRMQQAGVIPVCYSNVAVEILADNAAPEAEAVYGALGMPFSGLVFGLRQYFSSDKQQRRAK
jgi:nicotinamidase-related amidase